MKWIADTFKYLSPKQEHGIKTLYIALLILSLHWSLIAFVNSSFLEQFLPLSQIGYVYILASLLSLVSMFFFSHFLKRFKNFRLTILLSLLEILALIGMAFSGTVFFALMFFIIHFIVAPLLVLCLDVFIETIIGNQEKRTGSTRGLYLLFLSLTAAGAPLLSGMLIDAQPTYDLSVVYLVSGLLVLPFIAVITLYFNHFKDPEYPTAHFMGIFQSFKNEQSIRVVFFVQLLLQSFFAWMVIYTPIYLATIAGFSWTEIGAILLVALMAYVFFEYPIGIIADKYIGEKEMMASGFLIIAISTSWLAFLPAGSLYLWMFALFITRVGASLVEATSESYFFKHTQGGDTDKMTLYRTTRPLSSICIPLVGGFLLLYITPSFAFILLGALMIPGIFITLLLHDTR